MNHLGLHYGHKIITMQRKALGLCVAVLMAIASVGCTGVNDSYSRFYTMPQQGWAVKTPLHFSPDSLNDQDLYDIKVAVRYTPQYPYRNLSLAVDLLSEEGKAKRYLLDFAVADAHGNWLGKGFGSFYQCERLLAQGLSHKLFKRVVVWNGMQTDDILPGVNDVGIIITRSSK